MLAIRKPTTVEFGVRYCVASFERPLAVMQARLWLTILVSITLDLVPKLLDQPLFC